MPDQPETVPTVVQPPSSLPAGALTVPSTDGAAGTQAQDDVPTALLTAPGLVDVPGYVVSREIARGGMGVVYAAHDPAFAREVAVKVMHPGQRPGRFVVESKVTARLGHPGVPPVYTLGRLADGRPFLAMKLIEGRTLADELKSASRSDLPRLLDVVHRICQTVGFAHSRRIIHRDLKPQNVMVGRFGEVLVMDWGLAREAAGASAEARSPSDESTADLFVDSPASPPADATAAGQVKGTPAYMAPEQARGEPVDARADVFALGGILAAVLTGYAPFGGTTVMDTVRRAAAAELTDCFARLDACGADADLIAVARKCLAPRANERYADGEGVAAALAEYRAGVERRLRTAERERAAAEAKTAEERNTRREAEARADAERARGEAERARAAADRKRRRAQLVLAAALVLAAGAAGGFAWHLDRQASAQKLKDERDAAERRAADERADADRRAVEARLAAEREFGARQARQGVAANLALAADLRRQAKFAAAESAVAQAVELAKGAPELLPRAEQARRDLLFVKQLDDIRYRKWMIVVEPGSVGAFNTRAAPQEYRAAFAARDLDPTALDPAEAARRIAASEVKAELVAAADDWALYEPDPARRDRLLDAVRRADPGPWSDRLRTPAVWADKAEVAKLAAEADPDRTAPALLSALTTLMERHRLDPSAVLQAARVRHPADFELAFALGRWLCTASPGGRYVEPFEAARALRPDNPAVLNNLGEGLRRKGDTGAAVAVLARAIELAPDFAQIRSNLAQALLDRGDVDGAVAAYRDALRRDPALAGALNNLGIALTRKGDTRGAVDAFRKAVELAPRSAPIYSNWGNTLRQMGDLSGAIAAHHAALKIAPRYADGWYNLGHALESKKDLAGAADAYRKAIEIDPRYARAFSSLGGVLHDRGDLKGAIVAYRRAIELDPGYARAHCNLGDALRDKGDLDEAVYALERAIALAPAGSADRAAAQYNLGLALQLRRDFKGAVAAYREALRFDPKDVQCLNNMAAALLEAGDPDGAVAACRQALQVAPKMMQAHYHLGEALRAKRELKGAAAAYATVAELAPRFAPAFARLGEVRLDLNDPRGAADALKRATDLDPKDVQSLNNMGVALRAAGNLPGAVDAFERALRIDPKRVESHVSLGATLHLKGDLAGAVAAYEKALELAPDAAQPQYNLATVYLQQKKYPEAIARARAAIKADPKYVNAHAILVHLLQQIKDRAGERAALAEAAKIDPKRFGPPLAALPPLPVAPPPREAPRP